MVGCSWDPASISTGASICCDGCCLTATAIEPSQGGAQFKLMCRTKRSARRHLGYWREGREIILERSLRVGDELGGHLVSGHVDGVARIVSVTPSGFSKIFQVRAPDALAKYIAPKGSVALDGVSLTVNEVSGSLFTINLIPTTLDVTTWGERKACDCANMEVDLIARYVARLLGQ